MSQQLQLKRPGWLPRIPWITLCAWLACYVPRIGTLGFYYADSWISIVGLSHGHYDYHGSFQGFCADLAAKPPALAIHLLAVLLLRDHPCLWQAALAAAVLVSALLLFLFFRDLKGSQEPANYDACADLAAAMWVAAPLCLGATALPNMFNALLGQACFFWFAQVSLRIIDAGRECRRHDVLLGAGLLLFSLLSYEVYYFQFVTVLGLIVILRFPTVRIRRTVVYLGVLAMVQLACIAYNRMIGWFISGVGSKHFDSGWWGNARPSAVYAVLTYNLPQALRPFGHGLLMCAWVILAAALCAVAWRSARCRLASPLLMTAAVPLLLAGAYWVSTITCALAGYGITFLGVESRVSMCSLFIFSCFAWYLLHASAPVFAFRQIARAAAIGAVVLFAFLECRLVRDWRLSWELQLDVLRRLHRNEAQLGQLKADSVVVFIGPYTIGAAPVFQADPQLTIAVREEFTVLRRFHLLHPYFLSIYNGHTLEWTGKDIVQEVSGFAANRMKDASDVWIWNYFTGNFRRMQVGESIDPVAEGSYLGADEAQRLLAVHSE